MRAPLALVALAACVGATPVVYHPDVLRLVDSDSEKAVQVVEDVRVAGHQPRPVEAASVGSALMASGLFLDDDVRALAGPVAAQLGAMQPDESVRIVGWSEDAPRYFYVYVHEGRLQVVLFAGEARKDSYAAVLPTTAAEIHVAAATPGAAPLDAAGGEPAAAVPAAPAPRAATATAATPTAGPPTTRARHPRPRASAPALAPLTEAEARARLRDLDQALGAGLITQQEHRTKRKEVLARL